MAFELLNKLVGEPYDPVNVQKRFEELKKKENRTPEEEELQQMELDICLQEKKIISLCNK
jgi:hypothetical protein